MEILLTGNTALVTQHWITTACPQGHVLRTTRPDEKADNRSRNVVLDNKQRLEQLVDTYAFDRIVYFSDYLTPHTEREGELDRLRRMLQANRERPVQMLYLAGPESVFMPSTGKTVLAQAAERLCLHYAKNSQIQLKILRLPYLYAMDVPRKGGGLEPLFRQMQQGTLRLEEQAVQPVTALCMEDLAELVARIFDGWTPETEVFTVPQPGTFLYQELGEQMRQLCPGLNVAYGTDLLRQYPEEDGILRRRYGWFPRFALREDLPELWGAWQRQCPPQKKVDQKFLHRLKYGQKGRLLLETFAAWLMTEGLVLLTATQAQFRMVDFRLLFVVLLGTMHGLNMGTLAAALAAVSLVWGYVRQGVAPVLLFYEPSYWLAFLVYFVAGAVCGYVQQHNADLVRFAREECALLRQQLEFVQQLYRDTLAEKRSLAQQLLSRRDSFGKIYRVTRQLDVQQPQRLYRNAVQVMEDVLQNQSLTLYRPVAQGRFARLTAASPTWNNAARTLPQTALRTLWPVLEQGKLWVNRTLAPGLPMYAAAVRYRGEPVLLLLLWEAKEEQLTLYEQNLFRILSGLVETALRRALAYDAATQREQVLPGTRLLNPEAFTRRLAADCALQKAGMADHLLLRIRSSDWNVSNLWERFQGICRESDVIGRAADHSLCILLEQADAAALPGILRRLTARGISAQMVPPEEQLRLAGAKQEETV